ncbi:MAG: hypothetical protein AB1781_11135 [Pseudomonadota bacterium]
MNLISRLSNVYGPPDCANPAAYLEEVARLVRGFSTAEQDKAGDVLLRGHRGRQFPTPHEIVAACEEARKAGAPVGVIRSAPFQHPGWAHEDIAIADRLIVSEIGREAADNGWSLGLHDFCRYNHRLPNVHEKARIIREAREFDEAYAACCSGRGGALGEALRKLGESMLSSGRSKPI